MSLSRAFECPFWGGTRFFLSWVREVYASWQRWKHVGRVSPRCLLRSKYVFLRCRLPCDLCDQISSLLVVSLSFEVAASLSRLDLDEFQRVTIRLSRVADLVLWSFSARSLRSLARSTPRAIPQLTRRKRALPWYPSVPLCWRLVLRWQAAYALCDVAVQVELSSSVRAR